MNVLLGIVELLLTHNISGDFVNLWGGQAGGRVGTSSLFGPYTYHSMCVYVKHKYNNNK